MLSHLMEKSTGSTDSNRHRYGGALRVMRIVPSRKAVQLEQSGGDRRRCSASRRRRRSPVSPRSSADCPFYFFDEGLSGKDRLQPYARIDSLRRHVLRTHLNQASRHNYSLRGLPRAHSHMPIEDGPVACLEPRCDRLILENQMHYMNHTGIMRL